MEHSVCARKGLSPCAAKRGKKLNWNSFGDESIVLDLVNTTKREAVHELLERAHLFDRVQDPEALEQSILAREKVMSTGLGRGVAIAHGESPMLPDVTVALGLSEKGIEFDSLDGKPVHILFIVVNPKLKRGEYLEVLSTLTKLMRVDAVRSRLRCCTCISEVDVALHEALNDYLRSA